MGCVALMLKSKLKGVKEGDLKGELKSIDTEGSCNSLCQ